MSGLFHFHTAVALECPAGCSAAGLDSLRSGIATVPATSLVHHVTRIQARFSHARALPENDFARWVGDALRLPEVAERLAFVGSVPPATLEELRAGLLDVLDRAPARDRRGEAPEGAEFHFVDCRIVLAPLDLVASNPLDVIEAWPSIDLASVFYHLVEASLLGRTEQALIPWLREAGADGPADSAEQIVRAAPPLARLHRTIGSRWRRSMIGRRLLEKAEAPEAERLRDGRAAMALLAGRLKGGRPGRDTHS